MKVKKIIIVGGGTAGWLSAGFLSSQLPGVDITVIASDQQPIIGVGESTVPQFRNHMAKMGLTESDWMRHSGSTFKYGVEFNNWRTGSDTRWHGFGDFVTEKGISRSIDEYGKQISMTKNDTVLLADYWINLVQTGTIGEDEYYKYASDTYWLAQNHRAHADLNGHQYTSRVPGYAYHMNAWKVGETIKNLVAIPNGVTLLEKHIAQVKFNDNEEVVGLVDSNGDTHIADLYIDCTGFRRLLIGPSTKWISFRDRLPVNRAIGGRVYYENDQEKLCHPYTKATALSTGWSWNIGLRDDIGTGYVYDSRFISDAQAESEFQDHWAKQGKAVDVKVRLKLDNGILDRSAHRNVIACGLSANFLEPLEATSISFTTLINELVVAVLHKHDGHWDYKNVDIINRLMHREIKYTSDFLYAHYSLSQRTDTEFWREMGRNRDSAINMCHDWFIHQIDIYRREKDFEHTRYNKYDWAQMITSMRIFKDCPTRVINPALLTRAKIFYDYRDQMAQEVLKLVPTHWQLIKHINQD
jgi:tryptophan halogenase